MSRIAAQAEIFARSTWLQYVALFQWANVQGYVGYKLILPITQILFFVELGVYATGRQNALYFALGNAMQITANAGIFGVIATVHQKANSCGPLLVVDAYNAVVAHVGARVSASPCAHAGRIAIGNMNPHSR